LAVTAQAFASLPCHFEWREAPQEIFLNIALDFSSLALVEMTGEQLPLVCHLLTLRETSRKLS
jgi:hypothetical protein